ncbi:MDR family MFS transporter [Mucilaginibacter sp. X5P1]|uniref:MDR family MFS transporter n=1 Tax=Mucilaginibacter sp. X5P1 TaxID=2723088 RepID=UPI0016225849|nr:MFS transporter [Mucilaginibacter sp. X5P1]MBB6140852.1 putative MFS family arabinose efflux permease [Mucilaginibacter sp. X5P1]
MTSPIQLYKKAYTGLSRNSWYLCLVMLINRSGTMVIPFMTIYCIHQLHFTIVQAGYIMALFGLGSICGAFVGGKLTDKFGFYDLQIFALLSGGILFLILGYQHTFLTVGAGAFVLSFCNESFRPANSSAIAYYSTDENKTRSYSLNRLAVNLGWSVGAALGGFLAAYSYHSLFWVDGCTNILAALMLLKLIPRSHIVKAVKNKTAITDTSSAYKDTVYLVFIGLVILFAGCFFQLFTMQPVFYKTQWLLNERTIGFLMSLNGLLIVFIEMILIHRLEGRRHPLNYISAGVILVGIGFVLLNVMPPNILSGIVAMLFITFGEMFSMPFMNSFWITRTNNNNRGEYAGLYTMAWSTAQVLAPTVGAQLIAHGGFSLLWWIMGGICLVSAIGFGILYRNIVSSS